MPTPYCYEAGVPRHSPELVRRYTDAGWWGSETLWQAFETAAASYADRVALIAGSERVTYRTLLDRTVRLATALRRRGVGAGSVVAVQLPNQIEFVEVALAAARLGALFCPINVKLRGEVEAMLALTQAPVMVIPEPHPNHDHASFIREMRPRLPQLKHVVVTGITAPADCESFADLRETPSDGEPPAAQANDPWLVEFTSGTTGAPKGVVRTHNNTLFSLHRFIDFYDAVTPGGDEVMLAALPISFIFPFYFSVLAALTNGLACVLQDGVEPKDTLELIAAHRVTHCTSVPAVIERLVETKAAGHYDVSSLRAIYIGGDTASAERKQNLMLALRCDVRDAYGLTECTLPISTPPGAPLQSKLSTTGGICRGADVKIVDAEGREVPLDTSGHLMLRGPNLMAGYYRNPAATAAAINEDGWFASGDLASVDADGYVRIVGRSKEVIIRSGVNVVPQEVEGCLAKHPLVRQAAVFGVPNDVMGEAVWACVTAHPGEALSASVLQEFLRGKIASYKIPEQIFVVDELPVSATGKVLRRQLKERFMAAHLPAGKEVAST
jgi:acyl-CoA synthetase (AMP-forming)/AMP-acid ligase II